MTLMSTLKLLLHQQTLKVKDSVKFNFRVTFMIKQHIKPYRTNTVKWQNIYSTTQHMVIHCTINSVALITHILSNTDVKVNKRFFQFIFVEEIITIKVTLAQLSADASKHPDTSLCNLLAYCLCETFTQASHSECWILLPQVFKSSTSTCQPQHSTYLIIFTQF